MSRLAARFVLLFPAFYIQPSCFSVLWVTSIFLLLSNTEHSGFAYLLHLLMPTMLYFYLHAACVICLLPFTREQWRAVPKTPSPLPSLGGQACRAWSLICLYLLLYCSHAQQRIYSRWFSNRLPAARRHGREEERNLYSTLPLHARAATYDLLPFSPLPCMRCSRQTYV